MTPTLLIATRNPGKISEIKAILSDFDAFIASPQDLGIDLIVKETGSTYAENARLKAAAYLNATASIALADDSGLEVDALDGAPGLYSARFSPKENATDADRRAHLLHKLKGTPQPWTAHFHCTAVLAIPGGRFFETTGQCPGIIVPQERGTNGFGYDPIFFIPEYQATMAELPEALKNKISHRGKALAAMIPFIKKALAITD